MAMPLFSCKHGYSIPDCDQCSEYLRSGYRVQTHFDPIKFTTLDQWSYFDSWWPGKNLLDLLEERLGPEPDKP